MMHEHEAGLMKRTKVKNESAGALLLAAKLLGMQIVGGDDPKVAYDSDPLAVLNLAGELMEIAKL